MRILLSDSSRAHQLVSTGMKLMDSNTDSALLLLQEARQLYEQLHHNEGTATALINIATCYALKNDIPAATRYLFRAYPYCVRSPQRTRLMIRWNHGRFLVFKISGHSDSAIMVLQKNIPLVEQLGDTSVIVHTNNYIGSVLIDNQDYEKAYPYIQKAIRMNPRLNPDLLTSYINLAYIYSWRNDMDSAFIWADEVYKKAKETGHPKYERSASLVLVKYYLAKKQKAQAEAHAQNAVSLIDSGAASGALYVYQGLSRAYLQSGDYPMAMKYGDLAMKLTSQELPGRLEEVALYALMANIYHKSGNADKAYDMLYRYHILADSMHIRQRAQAVDYWEKQFQLSEKEKEIALKENQLLLQQNKVRSRNIWIAVIGGGLIAGLSLSGLLYSLYRSSKRKMRFMRQQKEIDELRATMEGEEKERNRIAVELHDHIGGMLSAASYSLDTIKNEDENWIQNDSLKKIDGIIKEVRNEIRKTAHTLMPDVLLRHSLPEAIRQYCSFIERDTGLQIDVQEQGNFEYLSKDLQLSLYRITQELIQNVLKHARATQAMVQIHFGKDIVSLTVEDNGIGMEGNGMMDGRGLLHIRNRLLVIKGKLSIDSEPGKGTSMYIEIQTDHSI